jgi:hypothetical protein
MATEFVRRLRGGFTCALVGLVAILAGCNAASGGGGGGGGGGNPDGDSGNLGNDNQDDDDAGRPGGSSDLVSFSAQIQPIFNSRCVACHSDAGAFRDFELRLGEGQAHASLVNQPSELRDDMPRVTPGDPERSFLFEKIVEQVPSEGARMPMGGSPLLAEDIALIESWIEQGALDN